MHITQLIQNQQIHAQSSCYYNGKGIPVVMYKGESYSIPEFNEKYLINPAKIEWLPEKYKGINPDGTKRYLKD